jgi:transcriptional regulator with XRE-family HTH domain
LAAVGRAIGVTGQAVGRYESEKDSPGGQVLLKLAEHFGVSTAFLMGTVDDPTRNSSIPADWEQFVRKAMENGFTPADADLALSVIRTIRKGQEREG